MSTSLCAHDGAFCRTRPSCAGTRVHLVISPAYMLGCRIIGKLHRSPQSNIAWPQENAQKKPRRIYLKGVGEQKQIQFDKAKCCCQL